MYVSLCAHFIKPAQFVGSTYDPSALEAQNNRLVLVFNDPNWLRVCVCCWALFCTAASWLDKVCSGFV